MLYSCIHDFGVHSFVFKGHENNVLICKLCSADEKFKDNI